MSLVRTMSPEARTIFLDGLLPQLILEAHMPVVDDLYRLDYRQRPVSVRDFLLDPEYLGAPQGRSIYPRIIDDLEEIFAGRYSEIVLAGGIGWGKTRMAELGIIYEIYLLSCLRSPAEAYGLMPGSTLAFLSVSVTRSQAQHVLFRGLSDLIRQSPYFRKNFPCAKIRSELAFPHNILAYPVATTEGATLGEGVFSAAFDEMNFMQIVDKSTKQLDGSTYDQAQVLYNRLSRRIRSRMNQRGRLPGHLWLISSSKYPNDFTERKEREASDDPQIFLGRYAAWETRSRSSFMPQNFNIEIGDTTKPTRILKGNEEDVNPLRILEVPMDYFREFEKDPDGSVRDYAGIAILTVRPYMPRRDLIAKMFTIGDRKGLKHPYSKLDVTLQDESDFLMSEHLHWITESKNGKLIKRIHSGLYFAHVDLAKTTGAAGVAIGHVVGSVNVERGLGPEKRIETRALIRTDLVLRIVAPPHGEIFAANIRTIFYRLSELGCQFGKITYDAFGSMESIQLLKSQGYTAEQFSLDTSTEGYEACKMAIYDGRVLCYNVPICKPS